MPQALFHRISIKRLQCTGIVGADIIYFPDSIVAVLTAGVVVELSEEINVYRYEAKRSNILPRLLISAGPFPGTSVVGKGSSNPSGRELRSFVSKNATFQRLHPDLVSGWPENYRGRRTTRTLMSCPRWLRLSWNCRSGACDRWRNCLVLLTRHYGCKHRTLSKNMKCNR